MEQGKGDSRGMGSSHWEGDRWHLKQVRDSALPLLGEEHPRPRNSQCKAQKLQEAVWLCSRRRQAVGRWEDLSFASSEMQCLSPGEAWWNLLLFKKCILDFKRIRGSAEEAPGEDPRVKAERTGGRWVSRWEILGAPARLKQWGWSEVAGFGVYSEGRTHRNFWQIGTGCNRT